MTLQYLFQYALDMAYIAPPGNDETLRTFKLRVYNCGSDDRLPRKEDKATASGHTVDAGVEKPTYGLGIGGNHIHVVHRGT